VLRHLRRLAEAGGEVGDGPLLQRFLDRRDEEAFAALVRRHGPLVLGLCRRVLRHDQDAEDAFQAAFLVLARKAGSIRKHESLGSWLYEVAYRIAVKARARAAQRRAYERQAAEMPRAETSLNEARRELGPMLDEELQRLPEKHRRPLVLCYLQGKTHSQAARELGWPTGSMSRHLARARELLRERLAQRGVVLTAGVLVAAMAEQTAAATVSPALIEPTARAALLFASGQAIASVVPALTAELVRGALRNMSMPRFLAAALVLVTAAGAGAFVYRAAVERPGLPPHKSSPVVENAAAADGEQDDIARISQLAQPRVIVQPEDSVPAPDQTPDCIFWPSPPRVVEAMLKLAEVKPGEVLFDLGCGDGRICVAAAKTYGAQAYGYEMQDQFVKDALENVKKNEVEHLVTIERRDIFKLDLSGADVVTLWLLPPLNAKLIPQLEKMKPGSRIVSFDFDMMDIIKPDKVIEMDLALEVKMGLLPHVDLILPIPMRVGANPKREIYLWKTPLKKDEKRYREWLAEHAGVGK
jgi:RNA polymerase sigma factor (sigma-70 family)